MLRCSSFSGGDGDVLGIDIDIDIREHNRVEIEKHPMFRRITMIEGSLVDESVMKKVRETVAGKARVLAILDSNHTHDHVLRELELYSPLVTEGSYLIVFDTMVEDVREYHFSDQAWGKGNNPRTAVCESLETTDRFENDKNIEDKLLVTVAPNGYLKCMKG